MRLEKKVVIAIVFAIVILTGGWWLWLTVFNHGESQAGRPSKITFDVKDLDQNGYIMTLNIKAAIDYEFCVPYSNQSLQQVYQIDPTIVCQHGPSGRIGCTNDEYLCIGNTAEKDAQSILCRLSLLDMIERIDQTFWE